MNLKIFLKFCTIHYHNLYMSVQDQEEDQRGPGYCQARKMNKADAIDRCKWRKMIKDVR